MSIGAACRMAPGAVLASGWPAWRQAPVPAALVCSGGAARLTLPRCYGAAKHATHHRKGWRTLSAA